jgi:hypothetical protein
MNDGVEVTLQKGEQRSKSKENDSNVLPRGVIPGAAGTEEFQILVLFSAFLAE